MTQQLELKLVIETEVCINCHIVFGIESTYRARLMNTHKEFYCPQGHGQHYSGETALDIAKKDLRQSSEREQRLVEEIRIIRKENNKLKKEKRKKCKQPKTV